MRFFSSFPAKINIFWRFYIISCLYVVKLLLSEETCYSDINCVDFDFFPNTYELQICKKIGPKEMKVSILASDIWGSKHKLTIFAKNSRKNRSFFYQF